MNIEDNKDLSSWLEEGLRYLYEGNVQNVAIQATNENGEILTSYFHCNIPTKLLFAGYIQQDAMLDTLEARRIKEDDEHDFIIEDLM